MKLISTVLFITYASLAIAQKGNLSCNVDFVEDINCVTISLSLSNSDSTLTFNRIAKNDTIQDIPIGVYEATFSSCDKAYLYKQSIEIVQNQTRRFYYRNTVAIDDQEEYYNAYSQDYYDDYYDSLYTPIYFNVHLQFGRGLDVHNNSPNVLNNFALDYLFGHDFLITKPIGIGYEFGFGYTQVNYPKTDLNDPNISYDKQRFTTFDISMALSTSFYIQERRCITLGARYRLPYFARWARLTGDEKISIRGLHKYNDISAYAQLGYDWGFVFAEYRFNQILRSPLNEIPQLSLGVRLTVTEKW